MLEDDMERCRAGTLRDVVTDEVEIAGRSSREGGDIPSSVYKKSI